MIKIKRILSVEDPRLRAPNARVTAPWSELEPLVRKMFKVMYRAGNGVGLAAPQVGWNVRLFIMNPDTETKKPESQRVFWNPQVRPVGDREPLNEGCLSAPGMWGNVLRHPEARLLAESPQGTVDEIFKGFAAQIVQHEVDHLDGIMCVDKFLKEV